MGPDAVTEARLRELMAPFVAGDEGSLPEDLYPQLACYLDLLLKWNARTNLTAVRQPEDMVRRHFGEGVFAGLRLCGLVGPGSTLLDVGSGAGFPGLPIQLVLPGLKVALAESQGKKASFLREAVRILGCGSEVWGGRVEAMPPARRFSVVTLRAVDRMAVAMDAALDRLGAGGVLAELTIEDAGDPVGLVALGSPVRIPGSESRVLRIWKKDQ